MIDIIKRNYIKRTVNLHEDVAMKIMEFFTLDELVNAALFEPDLHPALLCRPIKKVNLSVVVGDRYSSIQIEEENGENKFEIYLIKSGSKLYQYVDEKYYNRSPDIEFRRKYGPISFFTRHPRIDVGPLLRYLMPLFHVKLNCLILSNEYLERVDEHSFPSFSPTLLECNELVVYSNRGFPPTYLDTIQRALEIIPKTTARKLITNLPLKYLQNTSKEYIELEQFDLTGEEIENTTFKIISVKSDYSGDIYNLLMKRWIRGEYNQLEQFISWKNNWDNWTNVLPDKVDNLLAEVQVDISVDSTTGRNIKTSTGPLTFPITNKSRSFEIRRVDGRIAVCTIGGAQNDDNFYFRMIVVPVPNVPITSVKHPSRNEDTINRTGKHYSKDLDINHLAYPAKRKAVPKKTSGKKKSNRRMKKSNRNRKGHP